MLITLEFPPSEISIATVPAVLFHNSQFMPHYSADEMVEFDFDKGPALVVCHQRGVEREQEIFYGPFES